MSLALPLDLVLAWILASTRLIALLTVAPVFGHTAVPARVRVILGLLVTAMLVPAGAGEGLAEFSAVDLGMALLMEVLLGATLGFAVSLIFAAFGLLGEFMSIQGGLGAARVLDPTTGGTSVALASMLRLFGLMVFLAIDAHHDLLRTAALSFERLPVGHVGMQVESFLDLALLGGSIFEIAVRLTAPITVAMMVTNVALGILGRMMPQLNLMTVQLPAHVAMAMLLLGLGAAPLMDAAARAMTTHVNEVVVLSLGEG